MAAVNVKVDYEIQMNQLELGVISQEDITNLQSTILDINYVDFLQFQRYFTPQAELEEAFIYVIHKPIDFSIGFSCRLKILGHMVIGLKQVRVPIGT